MLTKLLSDPSTFFDERVKIRQVQTPLLLTILVGAFYAAELLVVRNLMASAALQNYEATLIILMALYLLVPTGLWIVFNTLWWIVARLQGARSRWGVMMRVTGYGFVSFIGTGISWAIGRYMGLSAINSCGRQSPLSCRSLGADTISGKTESIFGYISLATESTLFIVFFVIGLLFLVWGAYLWAHAIRSASSLSFRQSLITTAVPLLLYAAIMVIVTF